IDRGLPDVLKAEAEGILAWIVRGCLDWQRSGLPMPDAVQEATKAYRDAENVFGSFAAECCLTGANFRVRYSELYECHETWAREQGDEPIRRRRFTDALTEAGFMRQASSGVWYHGVA